MFRKFLSQNLKPIKSFNKFIHSLYDPKCKSLIEISSMRSIAEDINEIKMSEFRGKGINIQIEYYDSHRFDPKIKYNESCLPTVLILPSSEHNLVDFDKLIGSLTEENYRVLAFSFPGIFKKVDLNSNF